MEHSQRMVHIPGTLYAMTRMATGASSNTPSAGVKTVLMGKVPDRGGRPTEGRNTVISNMPAWGGRAPTGKSLVYPCKQHIRIALSMYIHS